MIKKYMRLAKWIAEDENPCYSRHIGAVITDPKGRRVIATGYNGPPSNVPHCDNPVYLFDYVWPQLTEEEKKTAFSKKSLPMSPDDGKNRYIFAEQFADCKTCPRKLIDCPSGKRLELCACAHAEQNAVNGAGEDLDGCVMFCYCGVPCAECTKAIIRSGIKTVYCYDWGADYSHGSRWLFAMAGVTVIERKKEDYDIEDD